MSDKKIIAVVGATGAQGGGLARALLADREGPFRLRAITRHPGSDKGKALTAAGAEVAAADLDDAASLREAFRGAHGVFCMTNYWEHYSPEKEIAQARNMAGAAKAAGVNHVIWSTLEDTRKWVPLSDNRMPTLQGKYKVPHYDAKGEANRFFVESGVPATLLNTSFYWDNMIHFGMAPRRQDGKLVFALPMGDKKLPAIFAGDIGPCAHGIFKRGSEFAGKELAIAGGHPTGAEMAAGLSRVLGEEVHYYAMPFNDYRALGFPGADDLGNMFQFKHDFNDYYSGVRDLKLSQELHPGIKNFDQWLAEYGKQIRIAE